MPDLDEDLIRQVALFSELPQGEVQYLARTLRRFELPRHTILFREGEPGESFYLIRSGQLEVIKAWGLPDEWLVSVREPGEYIGEMGLLNRDGLRTATVRSGTAVELLEMTRQDFDALLNRRPNLAYDMVRVLSQRLSQANDATIRDLRERNQRLEKAYADLKAAQTQIIIKEKLEHELAVARQVQASLLPHQTPEAAGWNFASYWEPAREVAGDFYDFIPGPADHWGVVIADVADKGMPSALFMALSRSVLRASLTQTQPLVESVMQANRLICADSNDSMFVTLGYAGVNTTTGEVEYVNAGHNPVLWYRAEQDKLDWLSYTGIPLGLDPDARYQQRKFTLAPGDFLLLYTDGVTDALDPQGQEFGAERLQQIVHDQRHANADTIRDKLHEALTQFVGGSMPVDDITIVAVKRDDITPGNQP